MNLPEREEGEVSAVTGSLRHMTSPIISVDAAAALVGRDLDVVREVRVLIEGGRIARIAPAAELATPEGAERVDATTLTLLPGFIDAHVHIGFFDPAEVIAGGVTTVRDLGWPPDEIFPLAERSRSADFRGPLITAAGTMITTPGGYPTRAAWAPPGTGAPVADAQQARAAVSANTQRGAAIIKIALNPPVGPVLPADLVRVIVESAHEAGQKVTAHIYGIEELNKALDAGVDELAHMLMSPERIPKETLERMVASGVAVVPTLSVRHGSDRLIAIDNLRRFKQLGGCVVYGTDLGNEGPGPGIDRKEVTAMAEAEMSPLEIVRSATVDAAAWLDLPDLGVVAEGARADLIGVRGDPTASPDALVNVKLVLRAGRRLR